MPAYGTGTLPTVTAGYPTVMWNNETVATTGNGAISVAAVMKRNPNLPNCLSVELSFAANPGAFSVDLEVADTNADQYYVTKATLNTGLNAAFTGRIEALNLVAKFVRLRMTSRTNSVAVTAKIF